MNFVTMTSEGVFLNGDNGQDYGPFVSYQDWIDRAPPLTDCMFSSSIDFPEDSTSDEDIILLADLLRGNNVSGKNEGFKYRLHYDKTEGWDVYEILDKDAAEG